MTADRRLPPSSSGTNSREGPVVLLDPATAAQTLAQDVRLGLTSSPVFLLPKYFYDSTGSALFDRITELPEYYCTRAEQEILASWAGEAMDLARPEELVELGSGSMVKANMLLSSPWGRRGLHHYVPFDVDPAIIQRAIDGFRRSRPDLQVKGVVGDFERHLNLLPQPVGSRMIAFLGSTIGNLDPPERKALLDVVRRQLGPDGHFLLGVDLVKDTRVLELAYNDAAGVTAAFNRNILNVVNTALDGDFRPDAFRHHAFYNASLARIEMHLVAATSMEVALKRLGLTVQVASGESIWNRKLVQVHDRVDCSHA